MKEAYDGAFSKLATADIPDPENSAVDPLQPIDFQSFETLMKDMENTAAVINRSITDV